MSKGLKLGLAGVGTVGGGLLQLLAAHGASISARAGRPIEVVAVSTLEHRRNPNIDISSFRRVQDPVALAQDPGIDVFIELMGGEGGVAKDSVEAALRAGKHVVTANKALLAHHGSSLAALAEKNGVALNFEAAVAGGIPIVKAIRESLAGNDISRVYGILNGTCNYILTKMEREGRTFADVLKEAQAQGYAEADPTFDIGGFDTAHKLTLLTSSRLRHPHQLRVGLYRGDRVRSRPPTSRRPTSLVIASSCSASHSGPKAASSNACTRPWCRSTRPSPKSKAC